MSKHIGTVYSAERNDKSPQANVDASVAGVEVAAFDPNRSPRASDAQVVTFQPADARTFAALVVCAADEVERMRVRAMPEHYLAARLQSAEEALRRNGKMMIECRPCSGHGCTECQQTGMYLKEETREHFEKFADADKPQGGT